jgi:hypothetical protein
MRQPPLPRARQRMCRVGAAAGRWSRSGRAPSPTRSGALRLLSAQLAAASCRAGAGCHIFQIGFRAGGPLDSRFWRAAGCKRGFAQRGEKMRHPTRSCCLFPRLCQPRGIHAPASPDTKTQFNWEFFTLVHKFIP